MNKLLTIISIIFLLQGCKTEYRKVDETYPDGKTKTEYIYPDKNDTTSYTTNVYYDNGKLMHRLKVRNNKFVDEKRSYYPNGETQEVEKLFEPVALDDSTYDCEITHYWEIGKLKSRFTYKNNLLDGRAYYYDSLGRLGRTDDFINGKLNGREIHYFPSGQIKELENVRNDSTYGFVYEFDKNGDTLTGYVQYGLSVNGVFYKKWRPNGVILMASYGDADRSFFIWKWIDKNNKEIKRWVDKGDNGKFIAPE